MLFFDSSPYYAGMKIASIAEKKPHLHLVFFKEGSKDRYFVTEGVGEA